MDRVAVDVVDAPGDTAVAIAALAASLVTFPRDTDYEVHVHEICASPHVTPDYVELPNNSVAWRSCSNQRVKGNGNSTYLQRPVQEGQTTNLHSSYGKQHTIIKMWPLCEQSTLPCVWCDKCWLPGVMASSLWRILCQLSASVVSSHC